MTARMLAPTAVLVLVLVGAFVTQTDSASKQRLAFDRQSEFEHEVLLVTASENLLLDAETGLRGYVITRDPKFLAPFLAARTEFPQVIASLVRNSDGPNVTAARAIARDGDSYVRAYGTRLVAAVRAHSLSASSHSTTIEGKQLFDALRAKYAAIARNESSDAQIARLQASSASHRASAYALVGLGAALALIAMWAIYLAVAVLRPIRRVANAADKLARGDLSARVQAPRAKELDLLARSFNSMADSLQRNRKSLERQTDEIRRSEAFLDSVLENIPNMIFVKDAKQLRFVRLNRAGEQLLGRSREAFVGKSDYDFFPVDEAEFFTAKDREVLETGELLDIPEEPVETAHNGIRYLHTRKIPLLDERGEPEYLVGISEDITQRKLADEAVRAAKEEAEHANRAKSAFLSRMSHELRTPLNSILGFGQLLEMEHLSPDQTKQVHYILKSGRHLLELINEVLDLSRIETGDIALSPEPVAIEPLLRDVVAMIGPMAGEREISVEAEPVRGDLHVQADHQRLRQVLLNLLSNAIKYNRAEGRVTIGCQQAGARVRIVISDTGRGIHPEQFSKMFLPFERLGAEEDAEIEGTGLGLALSYQLVERMRGTLSAHSQPGIGSTFMVELDAVKPDHHGQYQPTPTTQTATRHQPAVSARLLYIEDNLANVKLIERVLQHRPEIALETAMQGRLGVDLASHKQPDVIVLDLHLPDLSGVDVLRFLRSDERTEQIPVIVLSADASPRQAQRLRSLGANEYITKPLDVPAFLKALDSCLRGSVSVHA